MTEKIDKDCMLPQAACPGQIELPTPRERECLSAMRTIKDRVREIKRSLRTSHTSDTEKKLEMEQELKTLKDEWLRWEKGWQEAVRERMIYLGHEEPDADEHM